jgi:hypothetical protein
MMLASLRFNNVRSPEAIKALLDGDRARSAPRSNSAPT